MFALLRVFLLLVIASVLVGGVIVGLAADTGPVEKAVLAACGVLLVYAASRVNQIGRLPSQR